MQVFPNVTESIELAHPHDLLTRYFLIDIELFASLLEYYGNTGVVRLIDFGSLQCESPTTIDDHLKEVIGDLRFSAKFKNGKHAKVFLFFEHQSKKVKRFCLRCIRKLLEFYESCETNPKKMKTRDGKYPYSLVVVLYHGKITWKKMLQMGDLVSLPPGANRHFLSVPIIMIDLSLIRKKKLNGPPALVALLDTLQSASQGNLPENFDRIVGYFEEIKDDPRTSGWLNSLTHYLLAVTKTDKEVVARTLSKVLNEKEAEKMVMSTLEELYVQGKKEGKKEGIKEGKKEGEKEGEIRGKALSILKILNKRFKKVPRSISQSVNSYTDSIALDSLFELALDCETLAEFERELAH